MFTNKCILFHNNDQDLETNSSTILRQFLSWLPSFSQDFTNSDQNDIHNSKVTLDLYVDFKLSAEVP